MPSLTTFPITVVAILVALTVHECSHAFAAKRLGDDTAELMGRLTLNPLAHLDPLGAILFLLVGFGWAKPVPVDPRNLRHPVRDNAIIALAGPVSNLVLAFLAMLTATVLSVDPFAVSLQQGMASGDAAWNIVRLFLLASLQVNLALMAFNLLPVPPLDGSNILRMFIPWRYREQYEETMRYGPWILLGLLMAESFLNVPILSAWVLGIVRVVLGIFALVLG